MHDTNSTAALALRMLPGRLRTIRAIVGDEPIAALIASGKARVRRSDGFNCLVPVGRRLGQKEIGDA